jgi:hypothetical protein
MGGDSWLDNDDDDVSGFLEEWPTPEDFAGIVNDDDDELSFDNQDDGML